MNEQVLQHVHEWGKNSKTYRIQRTRSEGEHGSVSYISITSDDDNDDFNRDNSATPSILYSDRPLVFRAAVPTVWGWAALLVLRILTNVWRRSWSYKRIKPVYTWDCNHGILNNAWYILALQGVLCSKIWNNRVTSHHTQPLGGRPPSCFKPVWESLDTIALSTCVLWHWGRTFTFCLIESEIFLTSTCRFDLPRLWCKTAWTLYIENAFKKRKGMGPEGRVSHTLSHILSTYGEGDHKNIGRKKPWLYL